MAARDPKEPILREEYEERHALILDFVRKLKYVLAIYTVALFALGAAAGWQISENTKQTNDVAEVQREQTRTNVENCEQNGNPIRTSIRTFGHTQIELLEDQNLQTESFQKAGVYRDLFPNFPPRKLDALLEEGIEKRSEAIMRNQAALVPAHPVNCKARFGQKSPKK